jgi:hypothetical protein
MLTRLAAVVISALLLLKDPAAAGVVPQIPTISIDATIIELRFMNLSLVSALVSLCTKASLHIPLAPWQDEPGNTDQASRRQG